MYERPVWEKPGQNMDKVEHQGVRPKKDLKKLLYYYYQPCVVDP